MKVVTKKREKFEELITRTHIPADLAGQTIPVDCVAVYERELWFGMWDSYGSRHMLPQHALDNVIFEKGDRVRVRTKPKETAFDFVTGEMEKQPAIVKQLYTTLPGTFYEALMDCTKITSDGLLELYPTDGRKGSYIVTPDFVAWVMLQEGETNGR